MFTFDGHLHVPQNNIIWKNFDRLSNSALESERLWYVWLSIYLQDSILCSLSVCSLSFHPFHSLHPPFVKTDGIFDRAEIISQIGSSRGSIITSLTATCSGCRNAYMIEAATSSGSRTLAPDGSPYFLIASASVDIPRSSVAVFPG